MVLINSAKKTQKVEEHPWASRKACKEISEVGRE